MANWLIFLFLLGLMFLCRLIYLIFINYTGRNKLTSRYKRKTPVKTVICLGSGGHTTEMLLLLKSLEFNLYSPRYYLLAKTDTTSERKIHELEPNISANCVIKIPRSRSVHQSYLTSIFTTMYAVITCFYVILKIRPNLILTNGPGTCVPVCLIGLILKLFFFDTRMVFVESICRVRSMSLTGKILLFFVDIFVVQSAYLKAQYKRVEYFGRLF